MSEDYKKELYFNHKQKSPICWMYDLKLWLNRQPGFAVPLCNGKPKFWSEKRQRWLCEEHWQHELNSAEQPELNFA